MLKMHDKIIFIDKAYRFKGASTPAIVVRSGYCCCYSAHLFGSVCGALLSKAPSKALFVMLAIVLCESGEIVVSCCCCSMQFGKLSGAESH